MAWVVWKRHDDSGRWRQKVEAVVLKSTFFGVGYTSLLNLRFTRTLAILLQGGVPLVEGLALAGKATGSDWIATLAERESTAIREGQSMAEVVRRIKPLSHSLPAWIQAGEASGHLHRLIDHAGQRYRHQWERFVTRSNHRA